MTARRRAMTAAVAAIIAIAILCGLGTWQMRRLAWKQGLIQTIAAKLDVLPVPLNSIGLDADFTKVEAQGSYVPGNNRFIFTTFGKSAGYAVVTPFRTSGNAIFLVDRGTIPADALADFENDVPAGEMALTGILRVARDSPSAFTPAKLPSSTVWYWWDVPAILGSMQLPPDGATAPVTLQLLPEGNSSRLPQPLPPAAKLANNHLQYAVTWFAFAVVLAVIAMIFIRQQLRQTPA